MARLDGEDVQEGSSQTRAGRAAIALFRGVSALTGRPNSLEFGGLVFKIEPYRTLNEIHGRGNENPLNTRPRNWRALSKKRPVCQVSAVTVWAWGPERTMTKILPGTAVDPHLRFTRVTLLGESEKVIVARVHPKPARRCAPQQHTAKDRQSGPDSRPEQFMLAQSHCPCRNAWETSLI